MNSDLGKVADKEQQDDDTADHDDFGYGPRQTDNNEVLDDDPDQLAQLCIQALDRFILKLEYLYLSDPVDAFRDNGCSLLTQGQLLSADRNGIPVSSPQYKPQEKTAAGRDHQGYLPVDNQ